MQRLFSAVLVVMLLFSASVWADEEGFRPLFNGTDLAGWVRTNTPPSTWTVQDGMLVCNGKPYGELRTERMFQNFILDLEWRHMVPGGNAGIFIWADDITSRGVPFHRGIEVQVLENARGNSDGHTTHGDIFPIHGATMDPINGRGGSRAFPTEFRSKPSPLWNHYRITCNDGEISLAVNGKVVTQGKDCNPRKGYICLESEGGIVHYRNIKIKELPDTPITDDLVAIADRGYRSIYTGLDLSGWKGSTNQWQPDDWTLKYVGSGGTSDSLASEAVFGDFGFVFDVRRKQDSAVNVFLRGDGAAIMIHPDNPQFARQLSPAGKWDRFEGELRGSRLTLWVNGERVIENEDLRVPPKGALRFSPTGPADFANIYVRELGPE